MSEHIRGLSYAALHDAERQTKLAFGENAAALELARDALGRIGDLIKGEIHPENIAILNQLKRQALSDATLAALKLGRFNKAEFTARDLLALSLLHGESSDLMLIGQPDDLG